MEPPSKLGSERVPMCTYMSLMHHAYMIVVYTGMFLYRYSMIVNNPSSFMQSWQAHEGEVRAAREVP